MCNFTFMLFIIFTTVITSRFYSLPHPEDSRPSSVKGNNKKNRAVISLLFLRHCFFSGGFRYVKSIAIGYWLLRKCWCVCVLTWLIIKTYQHIPQTPDYISFQSNRLSTWKNCVTGRIACSTVASLLQDCQAVVWSFLKLHAPQLC